MKVKFGPIGHYMMGHEEWWRNTVPKFETAISLAPVVIVGFVFGVVAELVVPSLALILLWNIYWMARHPQSEVGRDA